MSLPVRRMSFTLPTPLLDVRSYTAKMVPVLTLQSMFEEPSRGSNATQKRPACSLGTMIGSSFSSDTSTAHEPELTSALMKMSLERTSNFLVVSRRILIAGHTEEVGDACLRAGA